MNALDFKEYIQYHIRVQREWIEKYVADARLAAPGSPLRESINQLIRQRWRTRRLAQNEYRSNWADRSYE
jgi:hypothetical protein